MRRTQRHRSFSTTPTPTYNSNSENTITNDQTRSTSLRTKSTLPVEPLDSASQVKKPGVSSAVTAKHVGQENGKARVGPGTTRHSSIPRPVGARDKAARAVKLPTRDKQNQIRSALSRNKTKRNDPFSNATAPSPHLNRAPENEKGDAMSNQQSLPPAEPDLDIDSIPSIPSPPASPRAGTQSLTPVSPPDTEKVFSGDTLAFPTMAPPDKQCSDALRPLCPNTSFTKIDKRPSSGQLRPTKKKKRIEPPTADFLFKPASPPTVSAANIDEDGCMHLASSDCDLFISFEHTSHFEVWDMPDDTTIACPAVLYIMLKNPGLWNNTPVAMPDIALIDIECHTKSSASRFQASNHCSDRRDQWGCRFEGAEMSSNDSSPDGSALPISLDGISVDSKWERTYAMPTIGKGCRSNSMSQGSPADTRRTQRIPSKSLLLPDSIGGEANARPCQIPGRGWSLRFWIPVPTHLFMKKETRVFDILAKVWIDPGLGKNIGEPCLDSDHISAASEMSVSHLRKEREMNLF